MSIEIKVHAMRILRITEVIIHIAKGVSYRNGTELEMYEVNSVKAILILVVTKLLILYLFSSSECRPITYSVGVYRPPTRLCGYLVGLLKSRRFTGKPNAELRKSTYYIVFPLR